MQSLPVTINAAPPAKSMHASNSTDNSAQASEPFGNVLARQRANADAPHDSKKSDSKKLDSKQPTSASANDASATATATSNDPAQTPTADATATPSADMLAAMLPATVVTNNAKAKEKTDPQAPAPDGANALPSDMLAMLLPPAAIKGTAGANDKTNAQPASRDGASTLPGDMLAMLSPAAKAGAGANAKGRQESLLDVGKKAQPDVTAALGEIRQPAGDNAVSGNTAKDSAFAVALETLSKDGAKTAPLDTGAIKTSAQPVAPVTPDSLLQSGIAPVAVSQSGAAKVMQAAINTPVTDRAWGNEFNQKITWMATQHEQSAELHLNPPNLGPLDVVLKVSGDQATALFTSPHAAVREAVEQALPKLRDMMADNGITLGNATVSDQSPKDQQAWQADQQQKGNGRTSGIIDTTAALGNSSPVATIPLGRRHLGMLDTFA